MSLENFNILNKEGLQINLNEINKKIIGLYFSASWCLPCRKFTPILSTFYEDMIEYYDDIEIIYISSDKNNNEFNEYWEEMTFSALPYIDRKKKEELTKLYEVKLIPTLVFINNNGEIITKNGKEIIQNSNGNVEFVRNQLNI